MLGALSLSAFVHVAVVAVGLLLYVLATRLGRQRRHPYAAIAWVLAMVAFPGSIPAFRDRSTFTDSARHYQPAQPHRKCNPLRDTRWHDVRQRERSQQYACRSHHADPCAEPLHPLAQ